MLEHINHIRRYAPEFLSKRKLTMFSWDGHVPTERSGTQLDWFIIQLNVIVKAELSSGFEHFCLGCRTSDRLGRFGGRCREKTVQPKAQRSAQFDSLGLAVSFWFGKDLDAWVVLVGHVEFARLAYADVAGLVELAGVGAFGADLVLENELFVEH